MNIRKIVFALFATLIAMTVNLSGQKLELELKKVNTPVGGTVDVDLVVKNFTKVTVIQFELYYDKSVITYNNIVEINEGVTGLNEGSFGVPPGVEEGRITFSFNNGSAAQTLPDGSLLCKLRFNVVGADGTSSNITFDDKAFWSDESYDRLELVTIGGEVTVGDGTNGGGGGGSTDLTCTVGNESAQPNTKVCVPVTVKNFKAVAAGAGLGSFEGFINWDASILEFVAIENNSLPQAFSSNANNAANGRVKVVWYNEDSGVKFEGLDDGAKLFDICFNVIGSVGQKSTVSLEDWEWADDTDAGTVIPDTEVNGSVTVVDKPVKKFEISASTTTMTKDVGGCVDIKVKNFTDIDVMEYKITWDASVLTLRNLTNGGGLQNINIPELSSGRFSVNSDEVRLSWNNQNPVTVADNTTIYSLCFDTKGDCGASTPITFEENNGNFIIAELPQSDIVRVNGKVTIDCAKECSVTSVTNTCVGESAGAINVQVEAGGTCEWKNASGNVVSTDCNLAGVKAGKYDLTVTYSDGKTCSASGTVEEKSAPVISGDVTNATCGTKGSIEAKITGVTGTLDYSWDNGLSKTLSQKDLDPGTYTLTASDDGGCSTSLPFEVKLDDKELTVAFTKTDVLCFGDKTGSITLNVTGGCPDYTYKWSDNSTESELKNLAVGEYEVTVTDDSGAEKTAKITIDGPAKGITLDSDEIKNSNDNDGSITVEISGGAPAYTYAWSPGSLPNSNSVSSLAPGSYTLTVTDDNGCTAEFGPFVVVQNTDDTNIEISIKDFGDGAGVKCFGEKSGEVTVNVTGKSFPGELTIKGGDVDEKQTVTESGSVTFTELPAGSYDVAFKDSEGKEVKKSIEVTSPEEFKFDLGPNDVGCEDNSDANANINVTTAGGTGNLSYEWSDPSLSGEKVSDLSSGSYTVVVTDENGCSIMQTFTIVKCSGVPDGCYKFPEVITPNNDGLNDFFNADCLGDYPTQLSVYDRWGQLVYAATDYDGSWNGVDQEGVALKESAYMYVFEISFPAGKKELMTGTVTILRD